MNKSFKKVIILIAAALFFVSACTQGLSTAPAPLPTNSPTPVATTEVSVTSAPIQAATLAPLPTATIVPDSNWNNVPAPREDVGSLPSVLNKQIIYEAPPNDCATENNTELSCSTREGQATYGPLTLDQNEARVSTGDVVHYFQDGAPIGLPYPDSDTPQTLVVLLNISESPLGLTMNCDWGCFRGNFRAKWTPQLLADLRDYHLWAFLIGPNPIPTPNPVGPTPVVNCGDTNACEKTNVILGVWDGSNWIWQNGMYTEWNIVGNNWQPQ